MNRYPASVQRGHKARNDYARRETPGFFHWMEQYLCYLDADGKTKTCDAFMIRWNSHRVDIFWKNRNWLEMSKIWEARIGKLFSFSIEVQYLTIFLTISGNVDLCFFLFLFSMSHLSGVQKRSNYYSTSSQFLFSFDDNDSKVVSLKAWLVSNYHEYQWFGIIFCMDMKTLFLLKELYPIMYLSNFKEKKLIIVQLLWILSFFRNNSSKL